MSGLVPYRSVDGITFDSERSGHTDPELEVLAAAAHAIPGDRVQITDPVMIVYEDADASYS